MSAENVIKITQLNDFVFCPASIFFHNLYAEVDKTLYQSGDQINGTKAHETVDSGSYRTGQKSVAGLEVYCEAYGLIGKIDLFYPETGKLVERKKHIKTIYDGYVFQLYAQYFALKEMGYPVKSLYLYSIDDNKSHFVPLPEDDPAMQERFEQVIREMATFDLFSFRQTNRQKCERCIYEPMCDRSVKDDVGG